MPADVALAQVRASRDEARSSLPLTEAAERFRLRFRRRRNRAKIVGTAESRQRGACDHMRRREFMGLLAAAATGAPLAVRAQPAAGPQRPERVHRIGWLSPASGPGAAVRSVLQAMRDGVHLVGQTLIVVYRCEAGN